MDALTSPAYYATLANASFASSATGAVSTPDAASLLYYLDRYANTFLLPLVIGVGVVGNALSFCVFRFTALRNYPSNVYLSALAVADLAFLLALFLSWLGVLHVPVVQWPVVCRLNVYIGYVFGFLSVWLGAGGGQAGRGGGLHNGLGTMCIGLYGKGFKPMSRLYGDLVIWSRVYMIKWGYRGCAFINGT